MVVVLVSSLSDGLEHPLKNLLLRLGTSLEEEVDVEHVVEKDSPHVDVTVPLLADGETQE